MIKVDNISKWFAKDRLVLDGVSVTFETGKTNLVIGRSGSGKTVLINCLVGLYEINKGDIFYDETSFSSLNEKQRKVLRQNIGMIFQGGALFDSLTVAQNVGFPLEVFTDLTASEKADIVNETLKRVKLEHAANHYPSQISGGMVKRTSIARAIVNRPKYLFCDEPNSGLDPRTSIVIDELIKEITVEYNITTVINTHDMNSVMQIGDNVCYIHEGKKWWQGDSSSILHSDNAELNDFVFASEMAKLAKVNMIK